MTVTPLQVAAFIAAVANGGTLYRPSLIDAIGPEEGTPTLTFTPEETGSLPVSDVNLTIIQTAMREVITNARGTAHRQLATMRYRPYGKTGTAQNPFGISHAWFAGYSQVNNPDRPDIAVVVLLENAGEGSEMAAPVFRRRFRISRQYRYRLGAPLGGLPLCGGFADALPHQYACSDQHAFSNRNARPHRDAYRGRC